MTVDNRHHYLVERWDMDGRIRQRECFETSNGAIAYQVGHASSLFRVYCITHAECVKCNPYLAAHRPKG